MKKPSILTNTMSFFSLGFKIKRKIPINKISHIISSKSSFEFILCVPSEYDYRFSSGKYILISIKANRNTLTNIISTLKNKYGKTRNVFYR